MTRLNICKLWKRDKINNEKFHLISPLHLIFVHWLSRNFYSIRKKNISQDVLFVLEEQSLQHKHQPYQQELEQISPFSDRYYIHDPYVYNNGHFKYILNVIDCNIKFKKRRFYILQNPNTMFIAILNFFTLTVLYPKKFYQTTIVNIQIAKCHHYSWKNETDFWAPKPRRVSMNGRAF